LGLCGIMKFMNYKSLTFHHEEHIDNKKDVLKQRENWLSWLNKQNEIHNSKGMKGEHIYYEDWEKTNAEVGCLKVEIKRLVRNCNNFTYWDAPIIRDGSRNYIDH